MHNRLLPLFCLLWLLPVAVCAEQTVRIGLYQNSPKVAYSEAGQPEGIFVDLIEAIAREEGWELEYLPGTWSEGLERLAEEQIDLMPDVAYSAARAELFDFHRESALSSWFQVYARSGSGIRALPDLAGKTVMVLERSVQQTAFEQLVGRFGFKVTLISVPDYRTMFERVAAGEADAAITNSYYGLMHAEAQGLEDTAVIFHPSSLFFAAPKGKNRALLEAIDRHLLRMKQNPQSVYYRSLKRWTSTPSEFTLPIWVKIAALVVAVVLLMAIVGTVLLKRQVNARTSQLHRRNEEMAIINRTLRATGSSLDLATVLSEATRGALELSGFDGGVLCIRDPEAGSLQVGARIHACAETDRAANGDSLSDANCPAILEGITQGRRHIVLPAGAPGVPRACGNVSADDVRWNAFFPLEVRGQVIGILCLYSRQVGAPAAPVLVEDLCGPVALAMENARLYAQAQQHSKELERRVAERTHELAEARYAAESADRLKSAFLATMSHELRTPLNSIIGFTGLVLQELPGPLNEEQKRQLGMVRDSARHLLALINDVLDISKIEAGELKVISEPYDLAASIRKVIGIVAPMAEEKQLVLGVEGAEQAIGILGDARRVEQILLNLLSNAIKFTETGAVNLTLSKVTHYSYKDGAAAGEAVSLRVSDTGIGISAEDMTQLFQPFHQIDSTLSRRHEGTGLGLAICRRLTELMGGRIEAESRPGEGSTFTLFLPLHTPEGKDVA